MANYMTIGPALEIGGNVAQMTSNGRIQVTNPEGKIKTLSQDEFKKNLIKNADKINEGEDFEFKKDHKGLKLAGAAVGVAVASLGIIYHKEIGKYIKNFSFKKAWKDVKGMFNKTTKKIAKFFGKKDNAVRTVFDRETAKTSAFDKDFVNTKNTLKYKKDANLAWVNDFVYDFERRADMAKRNNINHINKQRMYENLFPAYESVK